MGKEIILNGRQRIYVAHICSRCKNPVYASGEILVEVHKSYVFSEKNAREDADFVARNEVKYRTSVIKNSRSHPHSICLATDNSFTYEEDGVSKLSKLKGLFDPCPNCGKTEAWQLESDLTGELYHLEKQSFPEVFETPEEAVKWAVGELEKKMSAVAQLRRDPENTARAMEELRAAYQEIGELERIIKDGGRDAEKLKVKLLDKTFALSDIQAAALGYTGEVTERVSGDAVCYVPEVNSVPEPAYRAGTGSKAAENPDARAASSAPDDCGWLFCPKCGAELIPGGAFCPGCGAKIS